MKGGECKLPIQEDHRSFLEKKNVYSSLENKKIAIVAAVLLFIAMSLMTVFTFHSINGISALRQEVDLLKAAVKVLQEEKHSDRNCTKDTAKVPNDYDEDLFGPDYEFETDGDYGLYEDYDNEEYDDDNQDNEEFDDTKPLNADDFTKDAKMATLPPRSKRSIIGYTQDGTPINSQEYNGRKKDATTKKNYRSSTPSPPSSYSHPFHPELKTHQDLEQTTLGPRQIYSRRLHVYQDSSSQEQMSVVKSGESHNSQEKSEVEMVTDEHLGGRTRHRQRRLEFDDHHVRTGRMKPLPAAHFSGDTSKYVLGQHDNFKGNGHLSHPHRIFVDWTESNWFHALGMDRHFSLSDGVLTIKEPGLYFIYAQIYYYDEHDINGYRVHRNDNETLLQCTTTTHSVDKILKGNSCFTAAAAYLNENDRITIGDITQLRYSLFEPGKSFFGVIKLGDVKIK